MPTKTNVTMNRSYPEVFTVEVSTGDIRQAMVLTLDQLKAFKAQVSDAIAEYERLAKADFPGYWVPQ